MRVRSTNDELQEIQTKRKCEKKNKTEVVETEREK